MQQAEHLGSSSSSSGSSSSVSARQWLWYTPLGAAGVCLLSGPSSGLDVRELSSHLFEHWARHPASLRVSQTNCSIAVRLAALRLYPPRVNTHQGLPCRYVEPLQIQLGHTAVWLFVQNVATVWVAQAPLVQHTTHHMSLLDEQVCASLLDLSPAPSALTCNTDQDQPDRPSLVAKTTPGIVPSRSLLPPPRSPPPLPPNMHLPPGPEPA
jgi:hypothetical protein